MMLRSLAFLPLVLLAGCTTASQTATGAAPSPRGFSFIKPTAIGGGLTAEITARGASKGVLKIQGGSGSAAEAAGLNYATRTICGPGGTGVAVVQPGKRWALRSNGTYVATFICTKA